MNRARTNDEPGPSVAGTGEAKSPTLPPAAATATAPDTAPAATADTAGAAAEPLPQVRPLKVLVVDDDQHLRDSLSTSLRMIGCRVGTAMDIDSALVQVRDECYDLAFCDLLLGEQNGIDLVPKLLAANPNLQVIVVTAFATFETAVKAVKAGAANYLQKPFTSAQIRAIVDQSHEELRRSQSMSDFEKSEKHHPDHLVVTSQSPAMQAAYSIITRAATADVPVLLRGESGTGKGMFARALHAQSHRASEPFVTINCPALTDELLSSELFGHIKGSFTGAVADQPGKVEAADGGTLFLDELGDLSPAIQAKLLRFLQEHRYERVGDTRTRQADVRVVAATNRDLETQVRDGRFREDLLYRLNVVEVTLPPLRERPEDIIDLTRHFLSLFAVAANRPALDLSPAAQQLLISYAWPGNIRELRNEIQRITVLWPSRTIEPEAFSKRIYQHDQQGPRLGGEHSLSDIESEHIRKVLSRCNSFEEAANILGIEPSTLWRKRRRLGL